MTKQKFDEWCNQSIPQLTRKLVKKYPRCKNSIAEDIVEFYEYVLTKALADLQCPESFLYTWIYNRHYRFFSGTVAQRTSHMSQRMLIKITDQLPDLPAETPDTALLEDLDKILHSLPLDDQKLYQLYYVDNLSTRAIGQMYNLSHTGIHKQIKKLQLKIKNQICLQDYYLD